MKMNLLIACLSALLCFCKTDTRHLPGKTRGISSLVSDTVNFNSQIKPILQKKCSPCHFAGGKMYDAMPFDNPVTILTHEPGIVKRIKDQPEASLVKQFIRNQAGRNSY
jgi:hypothetical protein